MIERDAQRTAEFSRHAPLEAALREVNGLLAPAEKAMIDGYTEPRWPVTLIMGSPRSGTTLCLQWLASTKLFSYPSNVLSRFYGAPYLGARIQQILTEYDIRSELLGDIQDFGFASNLGKTKGPLAPNEFWYFWRRFFHFGAIQKLEPDRVSTADTREFLAELAAIEAAFGKPFAMKGLIVNWDIPFVNHLFGRVIFVYVHRDEYSAAQSLVFAREKFYGDRRLWYSFKPPEYDFLRRLSPLEQVAGQVHFTNQAIEEGLARVEESRQIRVEYEELCRDPARVFGEICKRLSVQGLDTTGWEYRGPCSFKNSNDVRLPREEEHAIRLALARFQREGAVQQ